MSWGILVNGGQGCKGLRKPGGGGECVEKTGDRTGEEVPMSSEGLP